MQGKKVLKAAIITVRPKVTPGGGVDQLGHDPDPVSGPLNAVFQDITHPQVFGHLLGLDRFALVGESRVAGDYEYLRDIGQGGDDVFGNPISDVLLIGGAA